MDKEIGERIRILREQLEMSQEELSVLVGYKSGRAMICQIEKGKSQVPTSKLPLFADALHTTISYILGTESIESKIQEAYIIELFDKLDENGKSLARDYLELLVSRSNYSNTNK